MKIYHTNNANTIAELKLDSFQSRTFFLRLEEDWVRVHLKLRHNDEHFETVDPALSALDVHTLATWFINLSRNKPVQETLMFLEPSLRFELLESDAEKKTIKIWFNAELSPPWASRGEIYSIVCSPDNTALKTIGTNLLTQLKQLYVEANDQYGRKPDRRRNRWRGNSNAA